jgi:hypothetical protein
VPPRQLPAGGLTAKVSVEAHPGGRALHWTLDAAARAALVTVNPASTGPGPAAASNVTATRPAGLRGTVTVAATDYSMMIVSFHTR